MSGLWSCRRVRWQALIRASAPPERSRSPYLSLRRSIATTTTTAAMTPQKIATSTDATVSTGVEIAKSSLELAEQSLSRWSSMISQVKSEKKMSYANLPNDTASATARKTMVLLASDISLITKCGNDWKRRSGSYFNTYLRRRSSMDTAPHGERSRPTGRNGAGTPTDRTNVIYQPFQGPSLKPHASINGIAILNHSSRIRSQYLHSLRLFPRKHYATPLVLPLSTFFRANWK